jgi:hypothetical protein
LEDWNVRIILDNLNDVMSDEARSNRSSSTLASVPSGDPIPPIPNAVAQKLNFRRTNGEVGRLRRHWAIQFRPTPYDIEVWRSRNVVIRSMELNEFVSEIRDPARGLKL